jgi:hypothetical protein
VIAEISSAAFDSFFAWAPWVIGGAIYFGFYIAKRNEGNGPAPSHAPTTFACAVCGRRGTRELMVAQDHGGAVSWQCAGCAAAPAPATQ